MNYDLEERVSIFAEGIIDLAKKYEKNGFVKIYFFQLLRSSSSVGANYMEANSAESKKDFIHKIALCNKEIKETRYWLRLVSKILNNELDKISKLQQEAMELNKIFSKIFISSKVNYSIAKK